MDSVVPEGLEGRRTHFAIDLAYGGIFVAGFVALIVFGFDPRIAAFEGGIVLGYFLHVWEKMSTYERVLQESVHAEAERQVGREVQAQVGSSVEAELEDQVAPSVESEVQQQVGEEVDKRVAEQVEERVSEEVERIEEAAEGSRPDDAEEIEETA